MIGHTKSDNRMNRCWLEGTIGDALHALSCAAGYNIRWLLRAIARLGPKVVLLRLLMAAVTVSADIKSKIASRLTPLARFVVGRLVPSALGPSTAWA